MATDTIPAGLALRISSQCHVTDTGCLEWDGYRRPSGYGAISVFGQHRAALLVHRAMWLASRGPIADGLFVCHRCDNPPCCNLDHLFLGTAADNTHDMLRKGREHHPAGVLQPNCKLTEEQVAQIRQLGAQGVSRAAIGRQFGTSAQNVSRIVLMKRWNTTPHTASLGSN